MSAESPIAAMQIDVPRSLPLPTRTSHYHDLAEAKELESRAPSATKKFTLAPRPPTKFDPSNSVAHTSLATASEPPALISTNPTPKRVRAPDWHPSSTIESLSSDAQCEPPWLAQPVAQSYRSIDTHESQVSLQPAVHGEGADRCDRKLVPDQGLRSTFGKLQPRGEPASKVLRRERNSISARKYRQKRQDRIAELEHALAKTEKERDTLKVQLESWKTKAELLLELTTGSGGSGNNGTK